MLTYNTRGVYVKKKHDSLKRNGILVLYYLNYKRKGDGWGFRLGGTKEVRILYFFKFNLNMMQPGVLLALYD